MQTRNPYGRKAAAVPAGRNRQDEALTLVSLLSLPRAFEKLRECENPETGRFLRQRRSEVNLFDPIFSAPKSVG